KDLWLINTYFPHFAVDTTIVTSDDGTTHCLVQDFLVDGQPVSRESVEKVRQEVTWILQQNQKLIRETGCALDLVGGLGFYTSLAGVVLPSIKPHVSNIVMTTADGEYQVYLLDVELLRLKLQANNWHDVVSWMLAWISYYANAFLLKFVFKF